MNNVNLIGRLARDPEFKNTQNSSVVNFTLAVNRRFTQEGQPTADFINIVAWGKTAEFCNQYFKKGQQVAISGRIQVRNWDDEQGQKHYATEVIAEQVYFADSKRESTETNNIPTLTDTSANNNDYTLQASDLPF